MGPSLRGIDLRLRSSCVASRVHRAPLLFFLLAGLATQDCGSSPSSQPPTAGVSDKADNGHVAIDRVGLTGSIEAPTITLSVPIRAVEALGASGALHLRSGGVPETATAADAVRR